MTVTFKGTEMESSYNRRHLALCNILRWKSKMKSETPLNSETDITES